MIEKRIFSKLFLSEKFVEFSTETQIFVFQTLKQPNGSFLMHHGGEVDIRGVYCAVAVATLLNFEEKNFLFENTAQWLAQCQGYEGGFSGEPGAEAHGGYTFCGLAALVMLGHERLCDLDSCLRWLSFKQMKFEGGFAGSDRSKTSARTLGTLTESSAGRWDLRSFAAL